MDLPIPDGPQASFLNQQNKTKMRKIIISTMAILLGFISIAWMFNHVNPWAAIAAVFVILLLIF